MNRRIYVAKSIRLISLVNTVFITQIGIPSLTIYNNFFLNHVQFFVKVTYSFLTSYTCLLLNIFIYTTVPITIAFDLLTSYIHMYVCFLHRKHAPKYYNDTDSFFYVRGELTFKSQRTKFNQSENQDSTPGLVLRSYIQLEGRKKVNFPEVFLRKLLNLLIQKFIHILWYLLTD